MTIQSRICLRFVPKSPDQPNKYEWQLYKWEFDENNKVQGTKISSHLTASKAIHKAFQLADQDDLYIDDFIRALADEAIANIAERQTNL